MSTANMSLTLPTVSQTPGPQWASEINSDLSLIDAHDHTTGKGTPVPVAGLLIDDDIDFSSAHGVENSTFLQLASSAVSIPNGSLFRNVLGSLFYKNTSGVSVPIVVGSSVVAPAGSGFLNLTPPAEAVYNGGVFELWQDNTPGNQIAGAIQCGPISFSRNTVGAPVMNITPSASMVIGYTLTMPPSLPASVTSLLATSTAGVQSNIAPDNSTIEINSSTLRVKPLGIDTAQLADESVTTVKIEDDAVTQEKLGPAVFDQSSTDSGAYSSSTPTSPATEISAIEIPVVTLMAGRPVMVGLQPSRLAPLNNAYMRSQTQHTRVYIQATEPGGGTIILGQTEVDTGAYFPASSVLVWFIPTVSGNFKFEFFTQGVGGTSTFTMNYCRSYVYQF